MANRLINRKRAGVLHKLQRAERADRERLRDIHSKIDGLPNGTHKGHTHAMRGVSSTAVVENAAGYFEGALIAETREDHIVPRQSLTRQQMIGFFPQKLEMRDEVTRQLDHKAYDGKARTAEEAIKQAGLIQTTDQRVAWKSDVTLLRKNNPFTDPEQSQATAFRREGSITVGSNTRKFTKGVENAQEPTEVLHDAELQDEWLGHTDEL